MFAKVFAQIFESSIADDYLVRHVFMDLLVLADKEGYVDMTHSAISRRTNIPMEIVTMAIEKLEQPDPNSRSKQENGRRLIPIDDHRGWGWKIVNHGDYRAIQDQEARRDYFTGKKREQRSGSSPRRRGYVYYVSSQLGVKIGFSSNPWSRVTEMKTYSPHLELLATEQGEMSLEKERHKQFSKYRIDREWFSKSPELMKHINEVATMATNSGYDGYVKDSPNYAATRAGYVATSTDTDTEADTEAITTISPSNDLISPEMVAREGLRLARITSDKVFNQVCDQMRLISPSGFSEAEADKMIEKISASWKNVMLAFSQGKLTHTPWGAEKFFGEGYWDKPETWPWKEGSAPQVKRSYVGFEK